MFKRYLEYLKKIDLRIAVKTGIAASCSYFVAKWYSQFFSRPDILASGIWCVVTTIVIMQANIGGTYKAAGTRFLGVFIGSLMGGLLTSNFGQATFTLGASVTATILLCSLFQLKDAYRIAALTVAIIMVSTAVHPETSPWTICFFRSLDSAVGIIIGIVITHVVWPEQTWWSIRIHLLKTLQMAKECYNKAIKLDSGKVNPKEIDDLLDLLNKLHTELEDTKLDFFAFDEQREKWLITAQALDRLAESIAVMQGIPKDNITKILDERIARHLEKFIKETENGFDNLQSICMSVSSSSAPEELKKQEQFFLEELERFRNTHLTRNFPLVDVENFYSFFYHLRFIANQLYKIEKQLQEISSPSL